MGSCTKLWFTIANLANCMLNFLFTLLANNVIYPLIVPGLMAGTIAIIVSVFIPTFLSAYKLPVLLGGIVCVLFFTFYAGKYSEESKYAIEQAELKAENARLNAKSKEITQEVVVKYIDKIKYVTKWKEVPINVYVPAKADAKCIIDPDVSGSIRMLFTNSIKGDFPSSPVRVDGTTIPPK